MHIEVEVPEGQELTPGMRTRARINGGEWQDVIVQPASYRGVDLGERFEPVLPEDLRSYQATAL
jgi:hypothetical protein